MKIRNGFVSNSSSSSFVIKKSLLNDYQLYVIKDYYFNGVGLGMKLPHINERDYNRLSMMDYFKDDTSKEDRKTINNIFCYINWDIHDEIDKDGDECLTGFTTIDNFNMYEFFEKIGIDNSQVKWDRD